MTETKDGRKKRFRSRKSSTGVHPVVVHLTIKSNDTHNYTACGRWLERDLRVDVRHWCDVCWAEAYRRYWHEITSLMK